jgi:hypothetical protein
MVHEDCLPPTLLRGVRPSGGHATGWSVFYEQETAQELTITPADVRHPPSLPRPGVLLA